MGFDARVFCSCWKEGKTKPWPYDFGFHFDEEICSWWLDEPRPDYKEASEETRREWSLHFQALRVWMETCCEHPDMELIDVRVANVSGMAEFRWALGKIGWEHFPVLKTDMPEDVNDGYMSPATAQQVIDEVAYFNSQPTIAQHAFLVNSATDEIVQIYRPAREGIFRHHSAAQVDMGVDLNGFFIVKRYEQREPAVDLINASYHVQQPRQELFRAMRFEQRRSIHLGEQNNSVVDVEYINLDDSSRFVCTPGDGGGALVYQGNLQGDLFLKDKTDPQQFHVVVRSTTPADFRDTVDDLLAVCRVSVASGNPVYWH